VKTFEKKKEKDNIDVFFYKGDKIMTQGPWLKQGAKKVAPRG
jgi:hypothetical protein